MALGDSLLDLRRFVAAGLLLVGLVAPACAFEDVPRDHWARSLLHRAEQAGILNGEGGRFDGNRKLSRYELAAVVGRLLEKIRTGGTDGGTFSDSELAAMKKLLLNLSGDHSLLSERVARLEESLALQDTQVTSPPVVDAAVGGGGGVGRAITGFLSAGVVGTDQGANGAGGGFTRYHLNGSGTLDQVFFTLPQASLAIHHEVSRGSVLHMQFDFSTDAPNGVGNGVGLNEAYLSREQLIGNLGGKVGGFALPFQSWEVDGPFRTLTKTVSPSLVNTFFERFRVVGVELQRLRDVSPDATRVRFGLFNGNDFPVAPNGDLLPAPSQDDSVGLGALSRTATFDGKMGYYLDVEAGDDPERQLGWRVGYFNLGGDRDASAPATSSQEFEGFNLGLSWRDAARKWRVMSQLGLATRDFTRTVGVSASDLRAGYLMANYELGPTSNVTVRYDSFDFSGGTIQGSDAGGHSWLVGWNRPLSETDLVQFEYLTQRQTYPPRGVAFPNGLSDPPDDLVQLRYKVWF